MLFWGIGAFLLSRFGISMGEPLLDAVAATGIGFGCVGNVVMALCFFHYATPGVLRGLLAILFLLIIPFTWRKKDVLVHLAKSFLYIIRSTHPIVSIAFLTVFTGYFVRGLLPPSDFDGLMYHLATAGLYLAHGGFYHVYFNPQANFPMLTEMNFMIGLALGNDIICKTMSFCLGALALAVIVVLCKRHCKGSGLYLAACLVFMTFTNTIANMSNCYVDIPQAVWTMLSVLFMERFCEKGGWRYAVFAGIFGGMAMQTKIFGVLVLPILLYQLLRALKTQGAKRTGIGAAAVFLPAVLLAMPWYIKSFVYSGTVLSISHGTIIGQGLANPMGIATHSPLVYGLINVVGRIVSFPWTFSFFPHQHQSDSFGPLLLIVLPFLFFINVPHRIRTLLVYAGIFMAGILFLEMSFVQGGSSIRYCTFVLMLSAPLIVWTISRLSEHPSVKRMLLIMVVIMVACGMALFAKRYHKDWKAIAFNLPRDAYLASVLPEYPVIRAINSLRDGTTVMPVYNYSNYLITVPYITAYRGYTSDEEMMADFKDKNIRYIFANDKLDTVANRDPFPQIKAKQCVASANGFYLFKVVW
jgi:hypothetical protein